MTRRLLIAPLVSHATIGRVAALGAEARELYVADISTRPLRHELQRYPFSLIKQRIDLQVTQRDPFFRGASHWRLIADSLRGRGLMPEDRGILRAMSEVLADVSPSVVVVYYAAAAAHFARLVKKLRPDLPVVLIHNTMPITLERPSVRQRLLRRPFISEFIDYDRWLPRLDFLVCASEQMVDFIGRRFGIEAGRMAVLPDYMPQSLHVPEPRAASESTEGNPKVIFLGAPERWGPTIDNLDGEFLALAQAGIHIHAGAMPQSALATGFGHQYSYFSDDEVFAGQLAAFANGFDAALITYGAKQRRERFRSILPTRFLTSLTAAVPIAVRAGMFDAVESYVERHGLGFAYTSVAELRARLADRESMARYRANARDHLNAIGAERQAPAFDEILRRIAR